MHMEITAASSGSTLRETIDCSATINCAPTSTESIDLCGRAAWPPRPSMAILISSIDAMYGPDRIANLPSGSPGALCMP